VRRKLEGPFLLHGGGEMRQGDWSVDPAWDYRDLCASVMSYQPRGDWLVFMPYWLLLMAAGLVWWGLLVWRQRRIRQAKRIPTTMDAVA
jgi:hypothetical protein